MSDTSPSAEWGRAVSGWACAGCQHTLLSVGELEGRSCPWCAAPDVLSRGDELLPPVGPEKWVPFSVDRLAMERPLERTVDRLPRWVRPPDLTLKQLRARLAPVYLPCWLVDSHVEARWHAEIGFDYDVKTHRETFEKGQWRTHAVHRTHIDWEPRAGTLSRRIDNVDAPGIRGFEHIDAAIGPFSAERERDYTSSALEEEVGRVAVVMPHLSQAQAWQQARRGFVDRVRDLVLRACEGQHLERLDLEEQHEGAHWTLRLLPVWTTWYRRADGGVEVLRYSGQTGAPMGKLVASRQKATRWATIEAVVALSALLLGWWGTPALADELARGLGRWGLYLIGLLAAVMIPNTWRAGAKVVVLQDKPWLTPRR